MCRLSPRDPPPRIGVAVEKAPLDLLHDGPLRIALVQDGHVPDEGHAGRARPGGHGADGEGGGVPIRMEDIAAVL